MSKVQVLVTTMHQTDISKYTQMNLQTDAVIANQADRNEILCQKSGGSSVQLVTTSTRGTSRNRNIALAHSNHKVAYILFSDADLIFADGYEQLILAEFERHPEAEAIKFNIHDLSTARKISMRRIQKFERATKRNMASSGVCGLVIRADVLKKYNFRFREDFGPGTDNYCGEDTIFLMNVLKSKVRLYRSPVDIAGIDQTESVWFQGHDERFFSNAGVVIGTIYPVLSYLIVVRSAYKAYKRNDSGMGFEEILKCYYKGIKSK